MIRDKFKLKVIAAFLLVTILPSIFAPTQGYALTVGPMQPEYTSFEPANITDMVNLNTGDFTYSIPLLEVPGPEGGFPLALSYHSGITTEQEASWVGLGWDLNVGAISRSVNKIPDDWNGIYINRLTNEQVGQFSTTTFTAGIPGIAEVGYTNNWNSLTGRSGEVGIGINLAVFSGGAAPNMNVSMKVGFGSHAGFGVGFSKGFGVGFSKGFGGADVSAEMGFYKDGSNYDIGVNGYSLRNLYYSSFSPSVLSTGEVQFKTTSIKKTNVPFFSKETRKGYMFINAALAAKQWGSLYTKSGYAGLDAYCNSSNVSLGVSSTDFDVAHISLNNDPYVDPFIAEQKHSLSLPAFDDYYAMCDGVEGSMRPNYYENFNLIDSRQVFGSLPRFTPNSAGTTFVEEQDKAISYLYENNDKLSADNVYFRYDGDMSAWYKSAIGTYNFSNGQVTHSGENENFTNPDQKSFYNSTTKRLGGSRYVEWFTNKEIHQKSTTTPGKAELKTRGFIEYEPMAALRNGSNDTYKTMDYEGIGAIAITNASGVTYHFSLPVYAADEFQIIEDKTNPSVASNIIRKPKPYATSWLLTSITGPDYIDKNDNGMVDDQDWGYWVKCNYSYYSNGYMWRIPFNGYVDYNKDKNMGMFSTGRKQLYYLQSVETRSHIAKLILSERSDATGVNWRPGWNSNQSNLVKTRNESMRLSDLNYQCPGVQWGGNNTAGYANTYKEEWIDWGSAYDMPLVLKLDKVVLFSKNNDVAIPNSASGNPLPPMFKYLQAFTFVNNNTDVPIINMPSYYGNLSSNIFQEGLQSLADNMFTFSYNFKNYSINNMGTFFGSYITPSIQTDINNKSLKQVELNYNYNLAQSSPNSGGAGNGRLTLQSVAIKGANNTKMMPDYQFTYYNLQNYNKDNLDYWGYSVANVNSKSDIVPKTVAHNWSLKDIKLPTGATINIEYESDKYTNQAVWNNNEQSFEIKSIKNYIPSQGYDAQYMYLELETDQPVCNTVSVDQDVYVRFYITQISGAGSTIDNPCYKGAGKIVDNNYGTWCTTNSNKICAKFLKSAYPNPTFSTYSGYLTTPTAYQKGFFRIVYPKNTVMQGGGIRVSKINLQTPSETISTSYDYKNPSTNIESGSITYSPSNSSNYVQYSALLPSPDVLYEYVTVQQTSNLVTNGKSTYRFYTLNNLNDHFSKTDVTPVTYHDANNSSMATLIESKAGWLGQPISASIYDNNSRLVSSNQVEYYDKSSLKQGVIQNTFREIKFVTDPINNTIVNRKYYTTSSYVQYPAVVRSINEVNATGTNKIINQSFDFYSGALTEKITENSKGEKYIAVIKPAFQEYPAMGSKALDNTKKNMLSQEYSIYVFKAAYDNNLHKYVVSGSPLSASIQTWRDNFTYCVYDASTQSYIWQNQGNTNIWRPDKLYAWKGSLNLDGTFANFTDVANAAALAQYDNNLGNGWRLLQQNTLYDWFSKLLESRTAKGSHAAVKLGYNDSKVLTSVPGAKYDEITYTGAEDLNATTGYFGGQVRNYGTIETNASNIHTGSSSIKVDNGKAGFVYKLKTDLSAPAAFGIYNARNYKVSAWVKGNGNLYYKIYSGNSSTAVPNYVSQSSDVVMTTPDGWKLVNIMVPFTVSDYGKTIEVGTCVLSAGNFTYTSSGSSGTIFFDDFRFHPVASSMVSYVYDPVKGHVRFSLNNQNLYTEYIYNDAGRLTQVWIETANGKKQVSQQDVHYKLPY